MKYSKIAVTSLLIVLLSFSFFLTGCKKQEDASAEEQVKKPKVEVQELINTSVAETSLYLTGKIKPLTEVEVKALNSGTIFNRPSAVGDQVAAGTIMISMFDEPTESNFLTAQATYFNSKQTYDSMEISTQESVNQAELGLQSASSSLVTAAINNDNTELIIENNLNNALDNAVLAANSAMDTIYVSLITFENILNSVSNLSVLNPSYKIQAQILYDNAELIYNDIKIIILSNNNIEPYILTIINLIDESQNIADQLIYALNATIPDNNFPQASLDSAIASVSTKLTALSFSRTSLLSANQNINNTKLNNTLLFAIAENDLTQAQIGYNNAIASLETAVQNRESQIATANISLEQSTNQLTLATIQKNRLQISSPIEGVITDILIENGDQITAGMTVAKVAQIDEMVIEVEVAPEIAQVMETGLSVKVGDDMTGYVSNINPTASATDNKTLIEIKIENQKNKLIAQSFIPVEINVNVPTSQPDIFIVPLHAVSLGVESAKVKIVVENKIKTVNVEVGKTIGDVIEIISGLQAGEYLITDGANFLDDGTEIEIVTGAGE